VATESRQIDIAMPTKESEPVLRGTLRDLFQAVDVAPVVVNQVVVVDDESDDDTCAVAAETCRQHGVDVDITSRPCSLPKAREIAIETVDTEWFLFLDDDVRVEPDYIARQLAWTDTDRVGAVQGRKLSRDEPRADWVRRRIRRGGTHATMIRQDAVAGVDIPTDLTVLEDEYLHRKVEDRGYRWVLEPDARFAHENQERHPIGWTEGRVAESEVS